MRNALKNIPILMWLFILKMHNFFGNERIEWNYYLHKMDKIILSSTQYKVNDELTVNGTRLFVVFWCWIENEKRIQIKYRVFCCYNRSEIKLEKII